MIPTEIESNMFVKFVNFMNDEKFHTIREISHGSGITEMSTRIVMESLVRTRFGRQKFQKRHRGDPAHKLWEFKLIQNPATTH